MNKQTVIWTLVFAVPVALVALTAGYIYSDSARMAPQETAETASAPAQSSETSDGSNSQVASIPADETEQPAQSSPDAQSEAAETPSESPLEGPSFDVVGVEPTGETVVAGRSDAGAIVALTANGEVVGKSIANEAGEWTIILDEPLKPGDYDVGLEVHDEKGESIEESKQRLAVSVPQGGNERPLVVLNTPEGPSDILQKPETETLLGQAPASAQPTPEGNTAPSDQTTVAAAAGSSSEAASTQAAPSGQALTAAQSAASETTADSATSGTEQETTVAALSQEQANTPAEQSAGQTQSSASTAGQDTNPSAVDGQASISEQSPAAPGDAPSTDTAGGEWSGNGVQQQTASADTSDVQAGAQTTSGPAAPQVTVEAVESEPDKVYVAGTGKPGASVRVYVGEDYQGEAKVNSSGRWLVEGTKNVAEGDVEVRADLISEDGSAVDARAAVTFEKEQDKQIVLTKVVASGQGAGQGSQGADVQKSLPVVIIRKGDNLWRISRRLYGDGVRYTTIYQANQDQIRDPDLIYPGQVFLTPEGDLNWPKPEADAANRG
ncbi:LysM peptidoglycan-binding domain-containing protein [Roseibium sp. MMSF_3544]|uniref:LysM peptidoglycan-binding domain-containing protein n=1 Tax=unclassified Roseibium TaxID=2629323 RepID=UPI00273E1BD5|nr:LysM peptidoglycan-binding domain-containing protein [Roseibium sp. MMSF_3544]